MRWANIRKTQAVKDLLEKGWTRRQILNYLRNKPSRPIQSIVEAESVVQLSDLPVNEGEPIGHTEVMESSIITDRSDRSEKVAKTNKTMSKTYLGAIAALIGAITLWFGVPVVEGQTEEITSAFLVVGGFIFTLYGRIKAGGINIFGIK